MRCRATSRPKPRSRPPCGVGVAAAAGLTRRRSRQVAHGLLPADCCPPPWPTAACRLLSADCCPPPVVCRLPPAACHLLPAAVCYLRPSICCPSRPLPSVCHLLSARPLSAAAAECQTRPPPAAFRLPPVVCPPAAFRLPAHCLLPSTCHHGRPPPQPSARPGQPQRHPRCHRFGLSTRLSASLRRP